SGVPAAYRTRASWRSTNRSQRQGARSCPARSQLPPRRRSTRHLPTTCSLWPSTRLSSFVPNRFCQLVKSDDQPGPQSSQQNPWRRAAPAIDCLTDAAEQDDGSDQRITRASSRSRSPNVVLQRFGRSREEITGVVWHGDYSIPCEKLHQRRTPPTPTNNGTSARVLRERRHSQRRRGFLRKPEERLR